MYFLFNLCAKWGGWSTPCPRSFTPENDPVPIVYETWWAQGRSGKVRKNSHQWRFDPLTVQPVSSGYIGWAIEVHYVLTSVLSLCDALANIQHSAELLTTQICVVNTSDSEEHRPFCYSCTFFRLILTVEANFAAVILPDNHHFHPTIFQLGILETASHSSSILRLAPLGH
jgi:hypothetical protein